MKNKKTVNILIPAVILIWGIIFYKVIGNMHQTPATSVKKEKAVPEDTTTAKVDTFSVFADYVDPFLKTTIQKKNSKDENDEKAERTRNVRRRRVVAKKVRWPEVEYKGLIQSSQNSRYVVLMEINQRKYLFHQGDTLQNIFLKNFNKDSVHVVYKEEERLIAKNKSKG